MIEVLISTMNLTDEKNLIKKMNISGKSIIINQITKDIKIRNIDEKNYKLLSYKEKGLSKSRNKAIMNSSADICAIADDDLKYEDNYEEIIKNAYKKYPDADIIAFFVDNEDKSNIMIKYKEGRVGFLKSMKIQSSQITLKRNSIIDNNIKFDEKFGAGSDNYWGEENIFLFDCLRKGLKIYYIPQKLTTFRANAGTTWDKKPSIENSRIRGKIFYRMSRRFYPILIVQFAIRKRKLVGKYVSFLDDVKYMFKGAFECKKEIKKEY